MAQVGWCFSASTFGGLPRTCRGTPVFSPIALRAAANWRRVTRLAFSKENSSLFFTLHRRRDWNYRNLACKPAWHGGSQHRRFSDVQLNADSPVMPSRAAYSAERWSRSPSSLTNSRAAWTDARPCSIEIVTRP
jgi:hypothetical protein